MTIQEFNETKWFKGMKAINEGSEYWIRSVNFQECLLGLVPSFLTIEEASDEDDITWARCENCTLIA